MAGRLARAGEGWPRRRLRDGASLSDVANAQGVSHDDLIAAIKAGKPSDSDDLLDVKA